MSTRFINCEACQTEGRLLTNDGGPYDIDHGPCPVCNGEKVVEIETKPIDIKDARMSMWKPIDTAPTDGTRVLVWRPARTTARGERLNSPHADVDQWIEGNWWRSRRDHQPTHWMPLPLPPSD